jgi:uncharacterized membrane protein
MSDFLGKHFWKLLSITVFLIGVCLAQALIYVVTIFMAVLTIVSWSNRFGKKENLEEKK